MHTPHAVTHTYVQYIGTSAQVQNIEQLYKCMALCSKKTASKPKLSLEG